MDDQHIVKLNDRSYLLFVGVVAEAHAKGLMGVLVDLLQIPSEENGMMAIVKATARFAPIVEGGPERIFESYGDASPRNCSQRVSTALIRMADTRAVGRALRVGANIAHTLLEELGDMGPSGGSYDEPRQVSTPQRTGGGSAGVGGGMASYRCSVCDRTITKGQHDVSQGKHGQPLCLSHQKEADVPAAG